MSVSLCWFGFSGPFGLWLLSHFSHAVQKVLIDRRWISSSSSGWNDGWRFPLVALTSFYSIVDCEESGTDDDDHKQFQSLHHYDKIIARASQGIALNV